MRGLKPPPPSGSSLSAANSGAPELARFDDTAAFSTTIPANRSMEVQPPERVAQNLMGEAIDFRSPPLDGDVRPGRRKDVKTIGGANLMDPEQMRSIADDYEPAQTVGVGNHSNPAGRFLRIAAPGLGDDCGFRNAHDHQVFASHRAFGILVAAVSTQRDDEWSDAALGESEGVVQAGTVNRGGVPVVLRRPKNRNGV